MQIDPKAGLWLAGGAALVAGVSQGVIPMPDTVPPDIAAHVKSWSASIVAAYTVVAAAVSALSSAKSGPLVPPQ